MPILVKSAVRHLGALSIIVLSDMSTKDYVTNLQSVSVAGWKFYTLCPSLFEIIFSTPSLCLEIFGIAKKIQKKYKL
jgi:hypothetical protein